MDHKIFVHIIKKSENKFVLAGISEDKQIWYVLPNEYQNLEEHKKLILKPTIKNAMLAIKPINGYRKVGINLDTELKTEYFDEGDNLSFKGLPLEETLTSNMNNLSQNGEEQNFLIRKIQELELKLNTTETKLHQVEKKFILDKFDKNQNPTEWINQYEKECARHNIMSETNKIEALRFFVIGSSKDWYEANIRKLGLENWTAWKESFLTVFIDKGWSQIRKAYNFKYIGGSLMDYAIVKERLCLEVENTITIQSRINMIVVGLPVEVQDELDREQITTMENLFIQLRKRENTFRKFKNAAKNIYIERKFEKPKNSPEEQKRNTNETWKKPCFMCENLGWPNRYHPTKECRNRALYSTKKEVNLSEAKGSNDAEEAAEMMRVSVESSSLNEIARRS